MRDPNPGAGPLASTPAPILLPRRGRTADHPPAATAKELAAYIEHQSTHGFAPWAVEDRATGRLVGDVGLKLLELAGPEIEIGWVIAPHAWGRGLATEAAVPWLAVAWDDLGLDRLIAVIRPENAASRRVAEKLGMREEGMRRAYGRGMVIYALSSPRRAGA